MYFSHNFKAPTKGIWNIGTQYFPGNKCDVIAACKKGEYNIDVLRIV